MRANDRKYVYMYVRYEKKIHVVAAAAAICNKDFLCICFLRTNEINHDNDNDNDGNVKMIVEQCE